MNMDMLHDVALYEIFVRCDFKSIHALQQTNWRFREYIRKNRACFSKKKCESIQICKDKCGRSRVGYMPTEDRRFLLPRTERLGDTILKLNPRSVSSYDHEELANMSQLWWNDRREINLSDIVDIRRYSRQFDRCVDITIDSKSPIRLKDVLEHMETKNLEKLNFMGQGKIECTEDDLRKIGRVSNKLKYLTLTNISRESAITYDTFLDFIEIGSFDEVAAITIPLFGGSAYIKEKTRKRSFIESCRLVQVENSANPDDTVYCIKLKNATLIGLIMKKNT